MSVAPGSPAHSSDKYHLAESNMQRFDLNGQTVSSAPSVGSSSLLEFGLPKNGKSNVSGAPSLPRSAVDQTRRCQFHKYIFEIQSALCIKDESLQSAITIYDAIKLCEDHGEAGMSREVAQQIIALWFGCHREGQMHIPLSRLFREHPHTDKSTMESVEREWNLLATTKTSDVTRSCCIAPQYYSRWDAVRSQDINSNGYEIQIVYYMINLVLTTELEALRHAFTDLDVIRASVWLAKHLVEPDLEQKDFSLPSCLLAEEIPGRSQHLKAANKVIYFLIGQLKEACIKEEEIPCFRKHSSGHRRVASAVGLLLEKVVVPSIKPASG